MALSLPGVSLQYCLMALSTTWALLAPAEDADEAPVETDDLRGVAESALAGVELLADIVPEIETPVP